MVGAVPVTAGVPQAPWGCTGESQAVGLGKKRSFKVKRSEARRRQEKTVLVEQLCIRDRSCLDKPQVGLVRVTKCGKEMRQQPHIHVHGMEHQDYEGKRSKAVVVRLQEADGMELWAV